MCDPGLRLACWSGRLEGGHYKNPEVIKGYMNMFGDTVRPFMYVRVFYGLQGNLVTSVMQ